MRKSNANLPTHLRNGDPLPKSFADVCKLVPQTPRYKIVAYGLDSWSTYYRIVHCYYISLISEDPSRIQKFMTAQGRTPIPAYEDGKLIEGMTYFRLNVRTDKLVQFSGMITDIVNEFNNAYTMTRFHNLVQYSMERFGSEPRVMAEPDFT